MNILSVKNLSKIYGDENNHVIALDNVSFDVEIGEFIAIIGASGGGQWKKYPIASNRWC